MIVVKVADFELALELKPIQIVHQKVLVAIESTAIAKTKNYLKTNCNGKKNYVAQWLETRPLQQKCVDNLKFLLIFCK